jgi:branched-chain amino acid transport system permease protein
MRTRDLLTRLSEHGRATRAGLAVAAIVLFVLVPNVTNDFYLSIAQNVVIYGLLAMSLDLLAGYTGLVSLGHAAFFGITGYGIAYSMNHGFAWLPAIAVSLVGVLAMAGLLGLIAIRVRAIAFVMITLAIGQIAFGLAVRWTDVSGGDNGLAVPSRPAFIAGAIDFYYVTLVVFVLCAVALRLIVGSPFGLTLRGVRDNEERMRSLGYTVGLHKYLAFVISAFFAGIAGVLFAFFNLYMSPSAIDFQHNALAVLMTFTGGLGTLWGGVVGAVVVMFFQQWLSQYTPRWITFLGIVFVLTVLFARRGIYGSARHALARRVAGDRADRHSLVALGQEDVVLQEVGDGAGRVA